MPPVRPIPPAKAVKTERTHEENQERAYIAASRRSDRSLEARVESARRASEIHKRRTGRSLRVTEQDVINEEMYEEEDDDLPFQYRRLTAHLQTGSANFNRQLAAYLTNQVAMRSAMEQMVNNPYAQQFPGTPNFTQNRPNMFQSPMLPQHHLTHSPTTSYRSEPYPSPHTAGFRYNHGRAYSTAAVPKASQSPSGPYTPQSLDHRRMSTPATIPPRSSSSQQIKTEDIKSDNEYLRQTQSATMPMGNFPSFWQDMGPCTTTLPPESQQMLGPALDMSDPFQAMLMSGSESFLTNSAYPWRDPQYGMKGMPMHPVAYDGLSATLAPADLDPTANDLATTTAHDVSAAPTMDNSVPSSGLDFNFSQESKAFNLSGATSMTRENSHQELTSGQMTPGEGFWNNFVQEEAWPEETAST